MENRITAPQSPARGGSRVNLGEAHRWRPPSPPTSLPFRLRTLGRIRGQPYHSTRGTFHDDGMLTVVLGGRGWFLRGGVRQEVGPGTVGLVMPSHDERGTREDPGLLMADPVEPYDHVYCRFAGAEALRIAHRVHHQQGGSWFFAFKPWSELGQLLLGAADRTEPDRQDEPERMSYADGILAAALAMLDTPSWDARSRHQLRPEALTRLLRQRIDQPMDLGWLAGELGLSKAHLCRLCRKWFDTSPGRLWTEMKMDWAAVLLREPSLSVAEVAKRVGYDDPFYFSKVFRRFHGRPPSRARAEPTCNAST